MHHYGISRPRFSLKSQFILEILVATVVLSRNTPHSILRYYIEGQWQSYFQAKDFDAIRMIQDSFQWAPQPP